MRLRLIQKFYLQVIITNRFIFCEKLVIYDLFLIFGFVLS